MTRLSATGNAFLVLVDLEDARPVDAATAARLLGRGQRADGLIRVMQGRDGADLSMELFNADGSRAETSGNGLRCLAWVAVHDALVDGLRFTVATDAGVRTVEYAETSETTYARVGMGAATFEPSEIPLEAPSAFGLGVTVDGADYEGDAVGMGNPHLVLFVADPEAIPVERHGPVLARDARFPVGTNVEFVRVESPGSLHMRVWERGVGETRSCGTGACAAVAAAHRRGLVTGRCAVRVRGGELTVELGETIWLGGPVEVPGSGAGATLEVGANEDPG